MIEIILLVIVLSAVLLVGKTRKLAFATTKTSRENPEITSRFANSEDIERIFGKR